jgi:hypothetical protein
MRPLMTMRRLLAATLGLTVLLVAVGSVWAANIVGTSRNDTIRGSARADKIYGRGGNDRLYGLGGNDLLVGGPGADRLVCGAGRDTASADRRDTVSRDCEVVRGITRPTPGPGPGPPPPPPPVSVTAGPYQGQINQSNFMYFELLSDRTVSNWRTNEIAEECENGAILRGGFWAVYPTPVPIAANGTFAIDWESTATADWLDGPARFHVTIVGAIQGSVAAGFVRSSSEFDSGGNHYRCNSGELRWVASRVP